MKLISQSQKRFSRRFAVLSGFAAAVLMVSFGAYAQRELGARPTDSGGPLLPEQAAYDVKFYDLALKVEPASQQISGVLTVDALIVQPTAWFVLDLDEPLTVNSVDSVDGSGMTGKLQFERRGGRIWAEFPLTKQPGEMVKIRVDYGGKPRVAPRPPWVGGFVWSKTPSGEPWVGVACQNDGADLWWPCKDHPSDEPDGVALHITVPQPLVCASNGKLESVVKNNDGTQTFNWRVSTPINNYDVTLNIAPYKTVEGHFKSVSGETVPATFWAIPEDLQKAQQLFPEFLDYLRFIESKLGPYPFRGDKIGIAETTYLGMEHQTITAYGNHFQKNAYGFDGLLFHEIGHEWWGNLVTASDWRDFWIHEGFQSFMDALYVGHVKGEAAYREYIAQMRSHLRNQQPIAPRESKTAVQVYLAAPDYIKGDGDIYSKGAVVLDTLRYLIGDEAFFKALRRMAYPDPRLEKITSGRQCRLVTTDDFRYFAEQESGRKLDWFFEQYMRIAALPRLTSERQGSRLILRWETPSNIPFPMPVEIQVGDKLERIAVSTSPTEVTVAEGQTVTIDPNRRVLRAD